MPATSNHGWGTPGLTTPEDTQETSVLEAVETPERASRIAERPATDNSWSNGYGGASVSSDDPASRFISALDNEVAAVDEASQEPELLPETTWGSSESSFTPPPASSWSYSAGEMVAQHESDDKNPATDVTWTPPSTWGTSQESGDTDIDETHDVDSAGFSDDGDDEVDYLSGDENIELAGEPAIALPPNEARDKAIALADELRRMIRLMGSSGESDHGAAVMALTEASLNVSDFSDVRGVVAEVKDDRRDIETLGRLAGKVDRLDALLDEHKALADAIELAITELNG